MRHLAASGAVLLVSLVAAHGAWPPTQPAEESPRDVSMIAAWLAGAARPEAFRQPFGDGHLLADGAIFYTDVDRVPLPEQFNQAPYDFVKARMDAIQNGNRIAPAVLITRSVAEEPPGARASVAGKLPPNARYYYIEVAIGNMAWHWMKVAVYEVGGKTKAQLLWAGVS